MHGLTPPATSFTQMVGQGVSSREVEPTVHSPSSGSPFGVIVDQDIVLHGQLEIWDFLTDPPEMEHRASVGLSPILQIWGRGLL